MCNGANHMAGCECGFGPPYPGTIQFRLTIYTRRKYQTISHIRGSAADSVALRKFYCESSRSKASTMAQSITLTLGMYWEKPLTAAQRRFTRACETLTRVRKLSRNTPALQINLATSGGQQVNVSTVKQLPCHPEFAKGRFRLLTQL